MVGSCDGRKKRNMRGSAGQLTQILHYIEVLGQTCKGPEGSSQGTTPLCAFFRLPDITSLTVSANGNNQILMVVDGWE